MYSMTLQKITIAVVDDDIHLSASLRRLLSSCGYQAEVFVIFRSLID
jgi:FixJ family two-component response regulator